MYEEIVSKVIKEEIIEGDLSQPIIISDAREGPLSKRRGRPPKS